MSVQLVRLSDTVIVITGIYTNKVCGVECKTTTNVVEKDAQEEKPAHFLNGNTQTESGGCVREGKMSKHTTHKTNACDRARQILSFLSNLIGGAVIAFLACCCAISNIIYLIPNLNLNKYSNDHR